MLRCFKISATKCVICKTLNISETALGESFVKSYVPVNDFDPLFLFIYFNHWFQNIER